MGQKTNPNLLRAGINRWSLSRWCAESKKQYVSFLHSDLKIRAHLKKRMDAAGLSQVLIERPAEHNIVISVLCLRPGMVIGRKGSDVTDIKRELALMTGCSVHLNVSEVRKPEVDAPLVAASIANQLEKRVLFRKAMKRAVQSAMRSGAIGIRVCVSGRLGGAEIARTEWYLEGRVPLHTFRADIQYATARASTTYGIIGVKVWVYLGDKVVPPVKKDLDIEEEA